MDLTFRLDTWLTIGAILASVGMAWGNLRARLANQDCRLASIEAALGDGATGRYVRRAEADALFAKTDAEHNEFRRSLAEDRERIISLEQQST